MTAPEPEMCKSAQTLQAAPHNARHVPSEGALQELVLFLMQPVESWRAEFDFDGLHSQEEMQREHQEMQNNQAACRCQAGLSLRKAVSQLPRLTLLRLSHVSFEEPSPDVVPSHPYSQLK